METIIKTIVRHFVFVIISFISLYLIGITFGGNVNYFSWTVDGKFWFALFAHAIAAMLHGYWYENR